MSFPYQSLKADQIRLLELVSQDPTPVFKLVLASPHSKPSYAALSYQWGPEGDVSEITVNEHQFKIRQNLDDALAQILKSKLIDRPIWVDAICIDQGSEDEKSIQVMRMRQIYEDAAKVLVWLGKPPSVTLNKSAFALMENFHKRFMKYQNAHHFKQWSPWFMPKKGHSQGDVQAAFLHELTTAKGVSIFDVPGSSTYQAWLGICSLWQSEWWTRTWVLQEATIPEKFKTFYVRPFTPTISSKVKFLFGDQQTDWSTLNLASFIAGHILRMPEIDADIPLGKRSGFIHMSSIRSRRLIEDVSSPLDIMQSFRMTDCFDPRDKIYAPLCLAPDDIRRKITPDYKNKTASELYTDVVRYHLALDAPNLDFLGYIIHQERSSVLRSSSGVLLTLPSWVPNFSHKLSIFPIPKILHIPGDVESRRIRIMNTPIFPSNKDTKIPSYRPLAVTLPTPYIDGLVLCINGVFIDEVKDIVRQSIPGKDKGAVLRIAREKSQKWHSYGNKKYFTGETFYDAYRRALVLDLIVDYLGRAAKRGGKYDGELQKKSSASLSAVEMKYQKEMKEAFSQATVCRTPGVSLKHYILIVPYTTEEGDLIWAFVGGRVLYVLRPIDRDTNHYTFIGECYVHGLMDGELDRRLDTGEAKVEQIRLL